MKKYKSTLIKNIYYMLCYAFLSLNRKEYEEIAVEKFEDIHNLFAAILAKGITSQIKHGLYKQYINQSKDLSIPRGRINMPDTIRNRINRRNQLACEYDLLSENNLYNQILKSTAKLLLRSHDVDREYKTELKRCVLYFSDIDEVSLKSIPWAKIRFHRSNRSYCMLLGICQLIIEGMLMTDENGNQRLASFVDNQQIHRLYEKFILEYYRKKYPQLHPSSSQIKWALDEGEPSLLPAMQSDIMLTQGNRVLIIDAKIYAHITQSQYHAESLRSAHLYQIFAYVKNKDAEFGEREHTVSGLLLYAATDEGVQPDVTYIMSGNRIGAETLDLNSEFTGISEKLNDIVKRHFAVS